LTGTSKSRLGIATAAAVVSLLAMLLVAGAASAAVGSISGTVKAAEGGAPIAGLRVCAFSEEVGEEEGEPVCAQTIGTGDYTLPGLQPAEYTVLFGREPNGLNFVPQWFDHVTDFEDSTPVTVTSGTNTPEVDADLEVGSQIEGHVTDPNGQPVGGVEICAEGLSVFSYFCTETDSGGDYLFGGLLEDEYIVEFFPAFSSSLLFQYYDGKQSYAEADPVQLGTRETVGGIDAHLAAAARIEGHVTASATGLGVPDTEVCALEASTGEAWSCEETRAGGAYVLGGLPGGNYKVVFFDGFEETGFATQFYNLKTTFVAADVIALSAPQTRTGIDAKLLKPGESFPAPAVPPPTILPAPKSAPKPTPLPKCRSGFHRKRVSGKVRCVRNPKRRHHRRHHKHRGATRKLFLRR
jgi:hypothetical protein